MLSINFKLILLTHKISFDTTEIDENALELHIQATENLCNCHISISTLHYHHIYSNTYVKPIMKISAFNNTVIFVLKFGLSTKID